MDYYSSSRKNFMDAGLTFVGDAELTLLDDGFDLLGVWRDQNGSYFLGTDEGSSEAESWDTHTVADLSGALSAEQAREEMKNLWRESGDQEAFEELIQKVR